MNEKKNDNPLYENLKCSLKFSNKTKKVSLYVSKSVADIVPHNRAGILTSDKMNEIFMKRNSSNNRLNFLHNHWKNIKDRAGVISSDSPYISDFERRLKEYNYNKRRYIGGEFNRFIDKATTGKSHFISNYVSISPNYIPPCLYQFRSVDKRKWISERNFSC